MVRRSLSKSLDVLSAAQLKSVAKSLDVRVSGPMRVVKGRILARAKRMTAKDRLLLATLVLSLALGANVARDKKEISKLRESNRDLESMNESKDLLIRLRREARDEERRKGNLHNLERRAEAPRSKRMKDKPSSLDTTTKRSI